MKSTFDFGDLDEKPEDTLTEKPVIFADTRTDAEKFDPMLHQGALDPGRIPGYSEIVMANDIAKADDLIFRNQNLGRTKEDIYRQIGVQPQELDVEFKWLRITGPGGSESHSARRDLDSQINQEGFRLASEENDIVARGYGFPPSGRRAEDGTIRRGSDVALYVRDGKVAQKWEAFRNAETARMENAGLSSEFRAGGDVAPTFEEKERDTVIYSH